jgi:SET domain-containing protein
MKIDKSKILQHLQSEVYCRLGVSRTHGVGVFALRKIPKGINPLVSWASHREFTFTRNELKGVPSAVRRQMRLFCTYDSQHIQVPVMGLNAMTLGMYLNHSKTPNIALIASGQFKSLRTIHQNEELFMDYDLAFGEVHDFSQD